MLLIDIHENTDYFTKKFQEYKYETRILTLPVGDIVYEEKGICIERKTLTDFVNSVKSGHLYKQLLQMQQFKHPHLFIINDNDTDMLFKKKIMWNLEHHTGAKARIWATFKIPIWSVNNDLHFVKQCHRLIQKIEDGKVIDIRDTSLLKDKLTTEDLQVKILGCFEGFGRKKSEKLLENNELVKSKINELIKIIEEKKYIVENIVLKT